MNGDDDDDDDDEEEHLAEPLSTAANVSPACSPLLRVRVITSASPAEPGEAQHGVWLVCLLRCATDVLSGT